MAKSSSTADAFHVRTKSEKSEIGSKAGMYADLTVFFDVLRYGKAPDACDANLFDSVGSGYGYHAGV